MSEWKAKVFWQSVAVKAVDEGFAVHLDERPLRTPAKALLAVPTESFAEKIASEWKAQSEEIDPTTMPATRCANAAIDKVRHQRKEVAALLAEYGASDLLCYRAEHPAVLVARQESAWGPVLVWAEAELGVRLKTAAGVMPIKQDAETIARMQREVDALDVFALSAFHDLVSLSGSLVLAFAVVRDRLSPAKAWTLSRIDEDFQQEEWGADDLAVEAATIKQTAFLHAAEIFRCL